MISAENALNKVNKILEPLEKKLIEGFNEPRYPVIFVIGTGPRCGHTLFSQLLAASTGFGYVNNFVARFWNAPFIGAKLGTAIGISNDSRVHLQSEYGRSAGWSGPHEFGYFLKRFLPFNETHQSPVNTLSSNKSITFNREIAALECLYKKPIFLRNIIYGLHIKQLSEVFKNIFFVFCTRDVVYQAQSIYLARLRVNHDAQQWWSLRPPEYTNLKEKNYWEQIFGQIFFTTKHVSERLHALDSSKWVAVRYEDVCSNPVAQIENVIAKLNALGCAVKWSRDGLPERLEKGNARRLHDTEFDLMLQFSRTYL